MFCCRKKSIEAAVVGNALVVSFLSADTPRVWRADIGQLQTATLEVQETQGKFLLLMKRNGAATEEISTFTDKKSATEALQIISKGLMRGQGAVRSGGGWFRKLLKFVLIALLILIVITTFVGRHQIAQQNIAPDAPAVQTGVPTPVDNLLGK